ncbi:MAG: hypothetical protein ACLSEB_10515, partial [Enterococcus faecium]
KRAVTWPFIFYTIIWTLSRSLSSKKNWVYSQTIFYGGIVLISLLSSTLYSLNIIDVSTSNSISIIGIIIAAIITQLFLVFGEKKRSKK